MFYRYYDEYRDFSEEEIKRQEFVDNSIIELLNKLNPTPLNINLNDLILIKMRNTLVEIFSKDLDLCTSQAFYP
jgi:trehalose/maltose hydrolase-like predicted phosphorylase